MTKPPAAFVVSPNASDADLAVRLLGEDGIEARAFGSLREVAQTLDERAGCLILVEEALLDEDVPALREALSRLPAWCDMPLIVVSRDAGALGAFAARAFPESGNVTLLERPLNPHTLISAVHVALRASARQQEVGHLIAERERAVSQRDEFLAMLGHELRNPLAPIRNAISILRLLGLEDPTAAKSMEILERQVNHVVRMVDDLMDVARLERGKVSLKSQRVDLNRVVAAAVDSCLPAAQECGHRIKARFGAQALWADADPDRVEQIVCNLVNNAIKFSPSPGDVRVGTSAEGGEAVLAVEDDGIGFEPGVAEKLFEPFVQVNPALERTAGGLGMGLTIVRRLVELHGGSVRASSGGPGNGSRFVVRIPLAPGALDAPAQPQRPPAKQKRRRVAVVEDNADIRETLRMLLTMWGHDIALAVDGPSGLALVLRDPPDIALIDVGLPGMNGYEVARAIRKTLPPAGIRLIAVTGYGQPSDREAALQAGFDAHLMKPITPEVLQRVLGE